MALPESLPSSKYSNPLQPSLPRRGLDCAAGLFIEKALKFQGKILHCIGVISFVISAGSSRRRALFSGVMSK
jgi:hypothetical protein